MIELERAWELLFENVTPLGAEVCGIEKAVGRTVAEDIVSPINVSSFRNSAMDGFAVRAEWLAGCSEASPVTLPIGKVVFAGDRVGHGSQERTVAKVMTGAPVPDGYDSIVKFENTDYDEGEARFIEPVVRGQHVREPGEDVVKGQRLFVSGERLGRLDVGMLAGVGLSTVTVYSRPSVLIAGTGSELVAPGKELEPGKIYDANSYTVEAMISPLVAKVECHRRIADRPEALKEVLDSNNDVIITSGGVSMGERDLVVGVAESLGWQSVFHKARIKPGKPIYFARRDGQLLFGLPGNPLSTAVTCSIFAIPALKKLSGRRDYRLNPAPAKLDPASVRNTGRRLIWPGYIKANESPLSVEFAPQKSSAALSSLLHTDGLIFQSPTVGDAGEVAISFVPWNQILDR